MFKKENGITLVALIITVIILLILAGVSIYALRDSGLFGSTQNAVNAYENAASQENTILNEYGYQLNQYMPR